MIEGNIIMAVQQLEEGKKEGREKTLQKEEGEGRRKMIIEGIEKV